MQEQFDFSKISYEFIGHENSMPFKTFFISVGYRGGHWHRAFEIILVLEGELIVTGGDETLLLKQGDLFLINPYEMHGFIKGEKPNLLLVIQIDPIISSACPSDLNRHIFKLSPKMKIDKSTNMRIMNCMYVIIREVTDRTAGYEYAAMSTLHNLITLLIRCIPVTKNNETELKNKIENGERLRVILDYINSHYENDISLQNLADLVHLSTFYVSHLVKDNTGLSFRENLSMIRTHHAINLMLNSDKKLIDIAFDSGFSDIKYFNRSFKKLYGETPSSIRKRDNWKEIIGKNRESDYDNVEDLIGCVEKLFN